MAFQIQTVIRYHSLHRKLQSKIVHRTPLATVQNTNGLTVLRTLQRSLFYVDKPRSLTVPGHLAHRRHPQQPQRGRRASPGLNSVLSKGMPGDRELRARLFCILFKLTFIWGPVEGGIPRFMCRGQRATYRNQFSSTRWVLGTELKSPRLAASAVIP